MQQPKPSVPILASKFAFCTLLVAMAPQLQAQQQNQAPTSAVAKPGVERIAVTGSRIRRTDLETHTPVVSISSEDIVKSGAVNVNQLLNQLPAMIPANGPQTSNTGGYAGTSTQDLRGLGATRTLVLVNGKRHVPAIPGTSIVDVSSIPTALIERVDVLTGGASAIYGADAVSGVVNIILKKQFQGTSLTSSYSGAAAGDGQRAYLSLTHGQDIEDGNLVYHLSYHSSKAIEGRDRDYVANDLSYLTNPDKTASPKYLLGRFVSMYNSNQRSYLQGDRIFRQDAQGNSLAMLPDGVRVTDDSSYSLAGIGLRDDYGQFYSRYEWARLAVPEDKISANLLYQQQVLNDLTLAADLKYVHTDSESRVAPLVEYGVTRLPADYAFYNAAQKAEVARTGKGLFFAGHFPEMGRQGSDYAYDLYQAVLSLEGTLAGDYRWQVSAQQGQTRLDNIIRNDYNEEHWQKAVWGSYTDPETYQTRTCGNGCVPVNVFQPLSNEAIRYLKLDPHQAQEKMTQSVLSASLDGDLFSLPAGNVALAAGVEHRRERSESTPSDVQLAGIGAMNYRALPQSGRYHVSEVFAELRVPLLRDLPLAQQLDLNTAWRTAKYNLAGTNHSWTAGLDWTPMEGLKLRASRAKAVRAPNINEIFQPQSQAWNYVYELCYSAYRDKGSQYRQDNCNKLGLSNPPNYYNDALILTQGNPALEVERAYTFTGGLVWSPQFAENLNLTVDFWDINLQDKIGTLPWDQVYPNCIDGSSLDSVFCQLIERKDGYMQLNLSYLNLARHSTRGVDYALDYQFPLSSSYLPEGTMLKFAANWGRLLERKLQSDPSAKVLETLGGMAYPAWRGRNTLTLDLAPLSVRLTGHYVGAQKPNPGRKAEEYQVSQTDALWYLDAGVSYAISEAASVDLLVSNLTDRGTPQVPGASTGGASWEMGYTAGLFDTIGRYYALQFSYQF